MSRKTDKRLKRMEITSKKELPPSVSEMEKPVLTSEDRQGAILHTKRLNQFLFENKEKFYTSRGLGDTRMKQTILE